MLRLNQPAWTGTMFRREVIDKVGTLDDASVIDLDFELRIAAAQSFVVLREPGAVLTTDNHFGKCLRWSVPWQLTIEKITGDQTLPIEIRQLARTKLEERLRRMVYETGIVASRMGKVDVARQAAEVLSTQYGDRRRAFVVATVAQFGRVAPWIAPPYKRLRKVARSVVRAKHLSESDELREELRAMAPNLINLLSEGSAL